MQLLGFAGPTEHVLLRNGAVGAGNKGVQLLLWDYDEVILGSELLGNGYCCHMGASISRAKSAAVKIDEPVAEPMNAPTIDDRVAMVLSSEDHQPSETLAALISEVDDAIDHADQAGRVARAVAGDPKVIDHGALGRALDAEHTAHRLRNGMAALQQLHHEALTRERVAQWHSECDAMQTIVLQFHDELVPMAKRAEAAKLEYDSACDAIDDASIQIYAYMKKCDEIEARAPPGEARRLPRPISGMSIGKFMGRKVAPVVPRAETVDYSLSFQPWKPDPDAPVLTYEERVAAHDQSKAEETAAMRKIYDDRAAAQAQREMENQRRAIAEGQRRRDVENGFIEGGL
jgi:hypothetical protein